MANDKQVNVGVTEADQDWRDGKTERECSCRVDGKPAMMKRPEYKEHMRNGTHNERMKSSAPKEEPKNGK